MKILVAEDNPIFANSIEMIIEELGYELIGIADNATDFFELFETHEADLLLLDIQLKDEKDGIDIAADILENSKPIPIIFMTSFQNNDLFERAKVLNPIAFLIKPLDALLLQHIIELAFHKNRSNWLEKEVQSRTQEIQKLNQIKDRILTIIGHDLRAPISALYSLLKMLDDKDISQEEFLGISDRLKNSVYGLNFMLNNILHWASNQMNGAQTKKERIDLRKLVEQIEDLFKEIIQSKNITFEHSIREGTTIWADANQIEVVLRNLVNNAIKYTNEKGKITIQATSKETFVEIGVMDTGVGMSEETQKKLFKNEPIGSQKGTHEEQGTGIGLMICKDFVENNAGTIRVESILKKGSQFYITLPTH